MFQQSSFYSSPILAHLPPQMIEKSKKDQKWKESCLNALEAVGRNQFILNLKLIENYEMVKGRFIPSHYFEQEEYTDMIGQLHKEFNIPSFLRHYDITSQVINTLSGEWQSRPDTFRVKDESEHGSNEYLRQKTDLLHKYVMAKIQAEVSRKMIEAGIDENGAQQLPPDQVEAYQQQIEQAKQQMTPPEVDQYMMTSWQTAAEMWGQHQLQLDRKRFRQDEKEKIEFEDMLIADRCFRHFYLTPTGYNQETWNPINVFFHASPDVNYVEDGDYAGRVFYLTIPGIIDRYGYKMTQKQIQSLQEYSKKDDKKWNYAAGTEYVFQNYMVPFRDYPAYDMIRQSYGAAFGNQTGLPYLDSSFFSSLYSGKYFNEAKGYYFVVEGYWKSQEKIGKINFVDPETGMLTKLLVDEDVAIPEGFKQVDSEFYGDTDEPNTVVWTWVNRVWKGIKICTKNHGGFTEDIFLDVKPLEFQFKGDYNPYGAKLPVCGQVFSVRNSISRSLVDLMKPHQIGYNVAMNQAYQEMQKDYGKFLIMDVNMFADMKDWGGSNTYEKFMLIAKELGVTVVDTSPSNTKGAHAASGGQMPREIDMDASARILSRLKIAEAFEQFALKQIGFNQYRLGEQGSSSTATAVQQGQQRSFSQTESYFTNFSNYLRRCHKMDLDIALYVQSQKEDIVVSYIKSDLSRALTKLMGTDLVYSDLQMYVWNSQEEMRQLEALRQLAMSNNTMGASFKDLADVITSNSPGEIKIKLEASQKKFEALQQQQLQTQQAEIENKTKLDLAKMEQADRQFEEEWGEGGARERIEYIRTFGKQMDNLKDQNSDQVPDILEYEKLNQQAQQADTGVQLQREKNQIQKQKNDSDRELTLKKLENEKSKIQSDKAIEEMKLASMKVLKGIDPKTNKAKKSK